MNTTPQEYGENPGSASVSVNDASVSEGFDNPAAERAMLSQGSTVPASAIKANEDRLFAMGPEVFARYAHLPESERVAAIQHELANYCDPSVANDATLRALADRINTAQKNPIELETPPAQQQDQPAQNNVLAGGMGAILGGVAVAETVETLGNPSPFPNLDLSSFKGLNFAPLDTGGLSSTLEVAVRSNAALPDLSVQEGRSLFA